MNNKKLAQISNISTNKESQISSLISKSKLNFIKNVRGFGSLLNNSSNYWKETFDNTICGCARDDRLVINEEVQYEKKIESLSKCPNQKPFKITTDNHTETKKNYTKEWNKEEIDLLLLNYYTNKIKNWKKLSQIIQTKSPQQCCYKIKKIEEKSKMKNFSRKDDIRLIELVEKYGKNWNQISSFFPGYSPENLEERYVNKLDPKLKRTKFTNEEDEKILTLYNQYGNNWKEIASYFADRNPNMIKNRFYSFLKKKNNIKSNSTYSNHSGSSSYVDTTSLLLSNNDILNDALNSTDTLQFVYNTDSNTNNERFFELNNFMSDNNTFSNSIDLKMNHLIIRDDNNNVNHVNNEFNVNDGFQNNSLDGFVETYQKVFPNQLKKEVDFDDSGSGNNVMIGSIKVSSNSDEDNENTAENSKQIGKSNFITQNNNNNNINSLKNSQNQVEQSQVLFNECKNLEELLQKIEILQNNNINNAKNNYEKFLGNSEYIKLMNKKEKMVNYKNKLNCKLQKLKDEYNHLSQDNKPNTHVLIEINEVLLQLIKVGKMNLLISKSLNDFVTNKDNPNFSNSKSNNNNNFGDIDLEMDN